MGNVKKKENLAIYEDNRQCVFKAVVLKKICFNGALLGYCHDYEIKKIVSKIRK